MAKFWKKPTEVDAIKWTGLNLIELEEFLDDTLTPIERDASTREVLLQTLNGRVRVQPGDWIVKGAAYKDFYPVKDEIFQKSFESIAPHG